MPDMTFARDGDLMILVHNTNDPSAADWARYCAAVKTAQRSDEPVIGLLVISEAGGPNAKQRAEVIEAFGPRRAPTAVCSNSALARGITTAIAWLYPKLMMSFRYEDVERALDGLGIGRNRHATLLARVLEFQREIGAKPFR